MNFFKELIRALTKILKSAPKAQAAVEYFVIFGVVTVLIIVMLINFSNSSFRQVGEEFFQRAVNGILGD